MRLFVAINLNEEVQDRVGDIVRELSEVSRREQAEIKWVKPEQLHFTLKFLGECMEDQVPKIVEGLEEAVQGTPPFPIRLGGLGCFPEKGPVRIIWLGLLEGAALMNDLAGRVDAVCELLGFPKEERPFSAHLTLGRTKSVKYTDRFRALIGMHKSEPVGALTIHSVALVRSQLSSAGPTYAVLKTLELPC